jgi:Zn-dependent M28 family amino/carboxypeptidase
MRRFHLRTPVGVALLACLLLLALSRPARAGDLVYSTEQQIYEDAVAGPCSNDERLNAVIALFKKYGATDEEIVVTEAKNVKNVVVAIPGTGPGTVILGAHYDKVSVGCGAVDNWSGVTLVAHAYKTLRQLRPRKTIVFVAFGGEETGLRGSKAMVDSIPVAERTKYCAMVNLDSFGLSRPQIMENTTTPKLRDFVMAVADACKVPIATARIDSADADSSSFKKGGVPAVTLHAVSADWQRILHTNADKAERIRPASTYLGYILVLNVLVKLDACECDDFR